MPIVAGLVSTDDPTALTLISDGLKRIESKVDDVQTAMVGKADKTDLAAFHGELRSLGGRVTVLERVNDLRQAKAEVHRERDERPSRRWKIIGGILGTLTGVVLAGGTVVSILLQLH